VLTRDNATTKYTKGVKKLEEAGDKGNGDQISWKPGRNKKARRVFSRLFIIGRIATM
jgi:hypothetical protein